MRLGGVKLLVGSNIMRSFFFLFLYFAASYTVHVHYFSYIYYFLEQLTFDFFLT